jgi:hypothetical protein
LPTYQRISEAIAQLAENELLRGGELDDSPRANEQLFRELLQLITDETRRSHLESHKAAWILFELSETMQPTQP